MLLVSLCEGVKEAPEVPVTKLCVRRLTPLFDYLRNLAWGDGFAIYCPNNHVVGCPVSNGSILVGVDTLVKTLEALA